MILPENDLREIVEAEEYESHHVPLHIHELYEFRGNSEITPDDSDVKRSVAVTKHEDRYQLRDNIYGILFEENISTLSERQVPMIIPDSDALYAGVEPCVRIVHDDSLWTNLKAHRSVDVYEGSTVANLVVFDGYDPEITEDDLPESVTETIPEDSETLVQA